MSVFRRGSVADYVPKLEELQAKLYPDSGFLFPTVSASRSPGFQHAPPVVMAASIRGSVVFVSVQKKIVSLSSTQGFQFIL